jgi:hypothetical protein
MIAGFLGLIGLIIIFVGIFLGIQKESNIIGQFLVSIISFLWDRSTNLAIFIIQLAAKIVDWLSGNINLVSSIFFWATTLTLATCIFIFLSEIVSRIGAKSISSYNQKYIFLF